MTTTNDTDAIPAAPLSQPPRRPRILGLAAASGMALFVTSVGTWAPDSPDFAEATADEIRQFTSASAGTLRLNIACSVIGVTLLLVFVASLAQLVRQTSAASPVPRLIVGCGAVAASGTVLLSASWLPFAYPESLATLNDNRVADYYSLITLAESVQTLMLVGPVMLLVAAFSWVALRERLVARWVCWLGLGLSAVALAGVLGAAISLYALDTAFLVMLFGWWLWPLLIGCTLGVRWLKASK